MKHLLLLISLILPLSTLAIEKDLQLTGRSLANYQICAQIGKQLDDPTLSEYYRGMFNDTVLQVKYYPLNEVEIVFKAELKSKTKLAKIDLKNMQSICLKRFDALSRKMQEKANTKTDLTL